MTPETTISLSFLMTIIFFVFSALTFFGNRKKDTRDESRELIKANVKLEQICATTSETRADIKSMNNQIERINETQIKQGMEIKALWKRVDQLKEECPVKNEKI